MHQDLSRLEPGYTVAFFDIDGTLTPRAMDTHDGNIPPSEAVRKAVADYVAAGNVAFISTGRGPEGVNDALKAMPFAGVLSLGGAYAVLNDEPVFDAKLDEDLVEDICRFLFENHLSAAFDGTGTPAIMQGGEMPFRGEDSAQRRGGASARSRGGLLFTSFEDAAAADAFKNVSKVNMEEKTWLVFRERFARMDELEQFSSGKDAHEHVARGITKKAGAQALLDALPEGRGEVLCFGDSDNDRELLGFADISVVMGSAPDDLKRGATYVTGSVAEEGVATALEALHQIWM